MVEEQLDLDKVTEIGVVCTRFGEVGIDGDCTKMAIILHPKVDRPQDFEEEKKM